MRFLETHFRRTGEKPVHCLYPTKNGSIDTRKPEPNTCTYPAKRRQATLGSDLFRDSRMRRRRIYSVRGSQHASPPFRFGNIRSCLLCLKNPGGPGAEPPDLVAYTRTLKFHFTLNQHTFLSYRSTLRDSALLDYLDYLASGEGLSRRSLSGQIAF